MSTQSDALLAVVTAYLDTPEHERAMLEGPLWGNPIICTPSVYQLASDEADAIELGALIQMQENGLIVIADDPAAERLRLASLRPGYQNRATRRATRKGAKRK